MPTRPHRPARFALLRSATAPAICLLASMPAAFAFTPAAHASTPAVHTGTPATHTFTPAAHPPRTHASAAHARCAHGHPKRASTRHGAGARECVGTRSAKRGSAHTQTPARGPNHGGHGDSNHHGHGAGNPRSGAHGGGSGGNPRGGGGLGVNQRNGGKSHAASNPSAPSYGQTEISSDPGAPGTGQNGGPPGRSDFGSEEAGGVNMLGESNGVVTDPIDPRFLTDLPFGDSSFWDQPWRAYLDTWPASRLTNALGINFNVGPTKAEATAQLLQESGFTLARREIDWGSIAYEEPNKLLGEAGYRTVLEALHKHGLRPLILLNANSGDPGPAEHVTLETTAPAAAGAQTVALTPASAAAIVPGKTGFDGLTFGGSPDLLITAVGADHRATLSEPLPQALAVGAHPGTTLKYAPFTRPTLPDGQPNPQFQETLAGWLSYVDTVCRFVAGIVGPEGYDLEIWNELGFGSQYLNAEHYYSPGGEHGAEGDSAKGHAAADDDAAGSGSAGGESEAASEPEYSSGAGAEAEAPEELSKGQVTQAVIRALLRETVAYVRNPANGIPAGVGVTDGFASQSPFPSGAGTPVGLTALSKHPYAGLQTYPAAYTFKNITPLNALGEPDIERGSETPFFVPTYQSLFPEVTLTGTHTETLVRDLAPFTNYVYGFPHGREAGPAEGNPPQEWVTEYNLGLGKAVAMEPDGTTPASGAGAALTAADKAHFHAKVALRSLVADVGKGIAREYFYAAKAGGMSLVGEEFFSALEADPSAYPGDALGGETMAGLRNLLAEFKSPPAPGPGGAARQLQLTAIAQEGNHAQFEGDGSAAHPDLYDRDVLAVLPFQSSPTRFVIPVYVMTRDLLTLYEPNQPATDIHRFDLPEETFRITLGNLPETAAAPTIGAYDPLRDESTPAHLLSRSGSTATIEIAATDYPRILTVEYP